MPHVCGSADLCHVALTMLLSHSNKHFDCTCAPLRAQYRCMFHTTALGSNHTPTDCSRSEKRVPPVVRSEWGRIV